MNTTAKEFLAKDYAGLMLCGQDEEGEIEWCGSHQQFANARALEADEEFPENHKNYPVKL